MSKETTKSLVERLELARVNYDAAVGRQGGVARARETFQNVLWNNYEAIVKALKEGVALWGEVDGLTSDVERLEVELADARTELADARKELAKAREEPEAEEAKEVERAKPARKKPKDAGD